MAKKNKENISLEKTELMKRYGNEMVRVVDADLVKRVLKKTWTPKEEAHFTVKQTNGNIHITPLSISINVALEDTFRYEAELDPSKKQIIPYCVLMHNKKVFVTHRLGKTGEQRLIGAYSCGTGGHITFSERVMDALRRELQEEVGVTQDMIIGTQLLGYILDESTAVNSVHCGIVYEVQLNTDDIHCLETEKLSGEWMTISELRKLYKEDKLESWSRFVVENHFGVDDLG